MVLTGVLHLSTILGASKPSNSLCWWELQRWNADVISGGRHDLIDDYTREKIEVEFILNCLCAESKNQKTLEAHNIMTTSVLEFISKIPGQSDEYTTPVFRDRIDRSQTLALAFNEFIWAFRDRRHNDCLLMKWWKCHHTPNASSWFDPCSGFNTNWNALTYRITREQEIMPQRINCCPALKINPSSMSATRLKWHWASRVHTAPSLMSSLGLNTKPRI